MKSYSEIHPLSSLKIPIPLSTTKQPPTAVSRLNFSDLSLPNIGPWLNRRNIGILYQSTSGRFESMHNNMFETATEEEGQGFEAKIEY